MFRILCLAGLLGNSWLVSSALWLLLGMISLLRHQVDLLSLLID
jgi:hypothetical protein